MLKLGGNSLQGSKNFDVVYDRPGADGCERRAHTDFNYFNNVLPNKTSQEHKR
jgi:hypothetical protein